MPTDDQQVLVTGTASTPSSFRIPGNGQIRPKAIFATFDGTNAAGTFLPAVKIISDGGETVGIYPTDLTVAAGVSADVSWFPGLGTGAGAGVTKIFDSTLAADAASIVFSGIPQGFSHLRILAKARTNVAALKDNLKCTWNTGINGSYEEMQIGQSGGVTFVTTAYAPPSALLGYACGDQAQAGHFGFTDATVHDYSVLANDHSWNAISMQVSTASVTATYTNGTIAGQRCVIAAETLTRLTVLPDAGTLLRAGSRLTVYGMP